MSSCSWSSCEELNEFTFNRWRLEIELKEWQENRLNGFRHRVSDDLKRWDIEVQGAPGPLYANDTYQLQVEIPENYSDEAPQIIFTDPVPVHPQVYNNGHICLAVLYDNWEKDMTLSDICASIHSMLSSASVKEKPKDNGKCIHRQSNCLPNKRKRTN